MVAQKIDKLFKTELTAEEGERAVVAMISTTAVDRDGDVVMPSGLDATNFNKLPTVLMMHDNHRLPVGRAEELQRAPNGIRAKAIMLDRPPSLPTNVEWEPDTLLDLFRQGAPLGFSIGFRIQNARQATKRDRGRFGEDVRRIITEWELLEFSIVPIPSNADAMVEAVSKCHRPITDATLRSLGVDAAPTVRVKSALPRRLTVQEVQGRRFELPKKRLAL
jgi:HK97 family phage prohead protease